MHDNAIYQSVEKIFDLYVDKNIQKKHCNLKHRIQNKLYKSNKISKNRQNKKKTKLLSMIIINRSYHIDEMVSLYDSLYYIDDFIVDFKDKRILDFENQCINISHSQILVTKQILIDFFCTNIPLTFCISIYGEVAAFIYSKIQPSTIDLLSDEDEQNKFINCMKKIFKASFIEKKNTDATKSYILNLKQLSLIFNLELKSDIIYTCPRFDEYHILLEPCTCSKNLNSRINKSCICNKTISDPSIFQYGLLDHEKKTQIPEYIIDNLINQKLTLIKHCVYDEYPFQDKLDLLRICYKHILRGYSFTDRFYFLPGLPSMIAHTKKLSSKKNVQKIIEHLIKLSDICKIVDEYMNDICTVCGNLFDKSNEYQIDGISAFHMSTDMGMLLIELPFVIPIIYNEKNENNDLKICYHGFDNKKPELVTLIDDEKYIVVHSYCFLNILYKYHNIFSGECISCNTNFL